MGIWFMTDSLANGLILGFNSLALAEMREHFLHRLLNFLPFDSIVYRNQFENDMQKIQKSQFGRLYTASKSTKIYELIDRDNHFLTFRGL